MQPMPTQSAASPFGSVPDRLDGPPPAPPGAPSRVGMFQQGGPSPLMPLAIEGMQEMEAGAKKLGAVLPGLMPEIAGLIARLRQAVPQAIEGLSMGGSSMPTGGPTQEPSGPIMPMQGM